MPVRVIWGQLAVTASTDALGKKMEALWAEAGIFIKYGRKVKALGVGLGAGVRRNVYAMKHRLRTMKNRVPRCMRLRKLGVRTSRLLRTSGDCGCHLRTGIRQRMAEP